MNYEFPLDRRDRPVADVRPEPGRNDGHPVLKHIDMRLVGVEDGGRSLVGELLAVVRRHAFGLCLWLLACLGAAAAYLYTVKPEFAATAQVVLEPRQEVSLGSDPNAVALAPTLDSAQAESQIQVIKSGRNLRYVFDTQHLADSPAYADPGPGPIKRLVQSALRSLSATIPALAALTRPEEISPEEEARLAGERAFQTFIDTVSVRRLGQSYVMEIAVRAWSPGDAVRLSNAVTMSYIRDKVMVRAASEQRKSDFLQNRISLLQAEKLVAAKSVAEGMIPDFQFPDSDARVVSAALEPLTKAYPQTKLILLLAAAFGVVSGIGAVSVREGLDRTIRSRDQVRRVLGIDCLCVFPRVRGWRGWERLSYRTVVDRPDSDFADALRVLRTSLFATGNIGQGIAIGVVSCSPGEGRSTIAANLAHLRAISSDRVMLIDADLQNPAMSRQLAPTAERGLNDLLLGHGKDGLPEVQVASSLAFVPAVRAGGSGDPNAFLGSHSMQDAFGRLDNDRDVIVDLPALSEASDAQAIGPLLTGVILVAAINRTTLDQLSEAVRVLSAAHVRLLGVVLNDVETTRRSTRRPPRRPRGREVPRDTVETTGPAA